MEDGHGSRSGAHVRAADYKHNSGRNTSVFPCLGNAICCSIPLMASDIARLLVNPTVLACISYADVSGRISLFLGNTLYAVAFGYYTIICFLGYNGMMSSRNNGRSISLMLNLASSTLSPPYGIASLAYLCLRHSMDHKSLWLQYS